MTHRNKNHLHQTEYDMNKDINDETNSAQQKKYERNTFIFLAVFLAPILSVAIVGALGFSIWFSQMFFGPPTV